MCELTKSLGYDSKAEVLTGKKVRKYVDICCSGCEQFFELDFSDILKSSIRLPALAKELKKRVKKGYRKIDETFTVKCPWCGKTETYKIPYHDIEIGNCRTVGILN